MALFIHKWQVGLPIRAHIVDDEDVDIDISTATTKYLIFLKPSGKTLVVPGSFTTDGTDGRLQFVTTSGWLDEAGWWNLQAHITTPTKQIPTHSRAFWVNENLYAGSTPNTIGPLSCLELTTLYAPEVYIGLREPA